MKWPGAEQPGRLSQERPRRPAAEIAPVAFQTASECMHVSPVRGPRQLFDGLAYWPAWLLERGGRAQREQRYIQTRARGMDAAGNCGFTAGVAGRRGLGKTPPPTPNERQARRGQDEGNRDCRGHEPLQARLHIGLIMQVSRTPRRALWGRVSTALVLRP